MGRAHEKIPTAIAPYSPDAVRLPAGTTHVYVADAFRHLLKARGDPGSIDIYVNAKGEYIARAPQGGIGPMETELPRGFLAFCKLHRVHPSDPVSGWSTGYTGEGNQNETHQITVDDFRLFAQRWRIPVELDTEVERVGAGRKLTSNRW